ncbi:hypothetical protein D083_2162 [Dickeya solani RNS 08.23.3.1.A]|nr:hypothetical protein D083_2162 [Dickeya solani RNS 08.23.3.1.A]
MMRRPAGSFLLRFIIESEFLALLLKMNVLIHSCLLIINKRQ